jgi:hypothetical protein
MKDMLFGGRDKGAYRVIWLFVGSAAFVFQLPIPFAAQRNSPSKSHSPQFHSPFSSSPPSSPSSWGASDVPDTLRINPEQMEICADVDARAGMLEHEGIVEIKIRRGKLLKMMERLDAECATLVRDSKDSFRIEKERTTAPAASAKREQILQPTYKQIALLYADLHE